MDSRRDFLRAITSAAVIGAAARAADAGASALAAAPTPTGSQLGSLYPFVKSQADKLTFPLSFTHGKFQELQPWKREARAKFLELLHYRPEVCDPRAEVVARQQRDGYTEESLSFQTTPELRVPATLLIPGEARKPAPGIVALHDHGGFYFWGREKLLDNETEHPVLTDFKQRYYGGKSVAAELARRGYVVLVIDMFYWGERRMLLDDDPADWRERPASITAQRIQEFNSRASQNEQLAARALMTAGITWPGVMFWDDIRSVDYLVTRPEVDPARIGCVGLSVGGLRSMHLAALDERIRAAVICGWMASFPAQLKSHLRNSIGFTKLVPGLYGWLDYPDVASLAMPSSILVINGRQDALFEPQGVQASFDKLAACYHKAGIPDRLRTSWYDTPHEFNLAMQTEAWSWLDQWLKES